MGRIGIACRKRAQGTDRESALTVNGITLFRLERGADFRGTGVSAPVPAGLSSQDNLSDDIRRLLLTLTLKVTEVFSRRLDDWHAIDWRRILRNVRRLQVRIVKAVKAGKWRLVRKLQHLLNHSMSGKLLAVRRVTENRGKKTPGVDGIVWDTPEKKINAVHEAMRQKRYKAQPLRRLYIPKKNGKKRPLGIPVMKDRGHQALHKLGLEPVAECLADGNSYGFRPERSAQDAAGQIFNALCRKTSAKWVLEGDIKACFDEISHEWLMRNVPMHKRTLAKWLKAGYMERETFH
ncbi:MAG: hypothetical protein GY862_15850, partial [Gammaproteobacteria bacterium]|nr:hypothetical protein [Gammaproteobacteria bacterium]